MRGMRRRCAIAAVGLIVCLAGFGCRTNPVTGMPELALIGEQQEITIGHRTHPNVVFMYDGEYHDPELNRYLGTIVMRLHQCSHRPEMPMEFTMLNSSVVNAFATPAHVYATRGFLARLENEGQFAAVMGHEISHVAAGHSARQLTQSLVAGIALGVADYAAGETLLGRLAVGAGQLSVTLLGLSYSREQERQADRVGTYYAALAGWDPQQAIAMQRLLASLSERKPGVLDQYLSTHPQTEDRVGEIETVIQEKELSQKVQGDGRYAERWDRRLARLRAVDEAFEHHDRGKKLLDQGDAAGALAAADEAIDARPEQAPFHRLRGEALAHLKSWPQAREAFEAALERDPRYVPATVGLGLVLIEQGRYEEAEQRFLAAVHGFPGGAKGYYGLGAARYGMERYREAIPPLQNAVRGMPHNPTAHYMLAVCYDETGQYGAAYDSYRRALAAGLSGPEADHARRRAAVLAPAAAALR